MSQSLITLVFTDLVDSVRTKRQLPAQDQTVRDRLFINTILLPHRHRVEANLSEYGGRVVKTMGDGYFIAFTNTEQAVQWAVSLQTSHAVAPIPTPIGNLQVKIGIHSGNPIPDNHDFLGEDVDCAARLVGQSKGGQILLTSATAMQVDCSHVSTAMQQPVALYPHGDRYFKGIGIVSVYEVLYGNQEPQPLKDDLDWREGCRAILTTKRRLTSNPLMAADGVNLSLDDIYVPLGLVERRQVDQVQDVSADRGSQLYQTTPTQTPSALADSQPIPQGYQISQTFQAGEFLEQVLAQGQSQKSQGRRIAIIGEPGAGKTTLLQKVGDWIQHNTDDLPIWISLADLQGESLESYLLQDWLKAATRKPHVTPDVQAALVEQFQQGRVWLLLDAVDEMTPPRSPTSGQNPTQEASRQDRAFIARTSLQEIAQQIQGWLGQARVVLTCRLNVWDAGKNFLADFDVYRNLNFSPAQVKQFTTAWFSSQGLDPQRVGIEGTAGSLADRLQRELAKPGRERVYDAVRNPFRLSLLCRIWQQHQGQLPKTRATLYQQFAKALYEWKQEVFATSPDLQQDLNAALGNLAWQAIDQPQSRFRLRHHLVSNLLTHDGQSYLPAALQLGWLNQVGVAAEDPTQPVYAFYHPTFQEYFAAQAIADWRFFLHHRFQDDDLAAYQLTVPQSRPGVEKGRQQPRSFRPLQTGGTYRVFEPQWREVMLLWLGRQDIPNQAKDEFIHALLNFDDRCDHADRPIRNPYRRRAFLLAVAGLAEFADCSSAEQILDKAILMPSNA